MKAEVKALMASMINSPLLIEIMTRRLQKLKETK